jgi:hypothetical protein
MSIVQMVAIVQYDHIEYINIVSLLISLISIGSKSVVISYSADKKTMLFNFCCYLADIFKTFAIVAFVFGDVSNKYTFFLFDGEMLKFSIFGII